MQQEPPQSSHDEFASYLTLKKVEQEVGISRVTLKKYLSCLGIEPKTWHIGDRSLYITQEEKERIKKLKQNPALLEQLRIPSPLVVSTASTRDEKQQ